MSSSPRKWNPAAAPPRVRKPLTILPIARCRRTDPRIRLDGLCDRVDGSMGDGPARARRLARAPHRSRGHGEEVFLVRATSRRSWLRFRVVARLQEPAWPCPSARPASCWCSTAAVGRASAVHVVPARPGPPPAHRACGDADRVRPAQLRRSDDRRRQPHALTRARRHSPTAAPFRADDPELLEWVHATACFGFLEAYHATSGRSRPPSATGSMPKARRRRGSTGRLGARVAGRPRLVVRADGGAAPPLGRRQRVPGDRAPHAVAAGAAAAGAEHADGRGDPARPGPDARAHRARRGPAPSCVETRARATGGRAADRIVLRSHPAVQACRRLGLADDFLFARG